MQKKFKWSYFAWACTFVLVTSLLSALFPRSNEIPLSIGFPARYLTIHVNQSCQFTTHIGAGSLIFDIGIGYCLCLLFVWIKEKIRSRKAK